MPKFYLRRFIDPTAQPRELIWVYERNKSDGKLRHLRHVAARTDYYAMRLPTGSKVYAAEVSLSKIEHAAAKVISRVESGQSQLPDQQRRAFSIFVAFCWSRVPKFRDEAERNTRAAMLHFLETVAIDFPELAPRAERARAGWELEPESVQDPSLAATMGLTVMGMAAGHLATQLLKMRWSFCAIEGPTPLITSDSPTLVASNSAPDAIGDYTVMFPVTPHLLFHACPGDGTYAAKLNTDYAAMANKCTAACSQRFVYSSSPIAINWNLAG